jgi:hypothetical protein
VRQSIQAVPQGIGNKANKADCHELVAAVYLEQEDKQRRMNSFVISGLTAGQSPDNHMVENLCRDELGLSVEVISCKRVGRQDLDKPRKLLVYSRSSEQAQEAIRLAKSLRKSSNANIRTSVYINPNLTKAEAKAQYDIRQKRRRMHEARLDPADCDENTRRHSQQQQPMQSRAEEDAGIGWGAARC